MHRLRLTWLGATASLIPMALSAQQAFVGVVGADTVLIEKFTRTPTRLEAEIVAKGRGREVFSFPVGTDGRLGNINYAAYAPGATGAPMLRATVAFAGDTALARLEMDGQTAQTQRIPSRAGAIAVPNASFAVFEMMLAELRRRNVTSDSVSLFLLSGGRTLTASFTNLRGDSIIAQIGTQPSYFVVDSTGAIVRGGIPGQRLRVERVRGIAVSKLGLARPSYAAPSGAPYTAEDVTVPTPGGHTLGGTLTKPSGAAGRLPLVITITGSGAQDRDELISIVPGGYAPFRQLADTLSRRGIAVLRYDDRGYGASGGSFGAASSQDFADDVRAAIVWARARTDIDPRRIFLMGHSEGGMIAPMVAATDTTLAGIVLLAGPGRTGREILDFQIRYAITADTSLQPEARRAQLARVPTVLDSALASSAWMKFFGTHDPIATARRVRRTPVLVLQGGDDQQVIAAEAPRLSAAFRAGGNRSVTMRVFPQLNHLFIHQPGGAPSGYSTLPTSRMDAAVVGAVVDWVVPRAVRR
jgi:uncharacterized protein